MGMYGLTYSLYHPQGSKKKKKKKASGCNYVQKNSTFRVKQRAIKNPKDKRPVAEL